MTKKPLRVSLIILTSNTLKLTMEMLNHINNLKTDNLHVECVAVDNASTDGTEEKIKNYKLSNMDYKYIKSNVNTGFSGGNNIGINYALQNNSDYLILMNNDLILSEDVLVKLVNFMETNRDIGICSPKMYFAKGYEFHNDKYRSSEKGRVIWYAGGIIDSKNVYTTHRGVDEVDVGQYDKNTETDVANGACMIARAEVFKKVGLLDSSFFLYWEDADFSERVRRAGYKVFYFAGAHVWHKVSSTTGGSGGGANDYFLTRNRFFYSMSYSSVRTKLAVLRDTINLILIGRPWQKWGAIDALLGRRGMGQWAYK